MIELHQKAFVCCDAPGCRNKQPATLVLLATGGFGAAPASMAWQVAAAPNGALLARCPEHLLKAEPPPVIPDAAAEVTP